MNTNPVSIRQIRHRHLSTPLAQLAHGDPR